ncbi:MAG: hypothetical protein DHS20C19_24070 [Acidimicrobiales bacterium]|nr:MAG: hypothetical protein DHS20C19_24070 [Acidimicrobiales bacterium]
MSRDRDMWRGDYWGPSLGERLSGAVLLVLGLAVGARVVAEIMAPLIPVLLGLLVAVVVASWLFGGSHRRW